MHYKRQRCRRHVAAAELSELYCFHSPFLYGPPHLRRLARGSQSARRLLCASVRPQQKSLCYQNLCVTIGRRLKILCAAGVLLPQFSSREKELLRGSIDFIGCRYSSPSSAAESSHQYPQVSTTTLPALSLSPPSLTRPRPSVTMATVGAILAPSTVCNRLRAPLSVLNSSHYCVAHAAAQ